MRFRTTFAQTNEGNAADNARQAVRVIKDGLSGIKPVLILFFASTDYEPNVLASEMHSAFPGVTTFGCTTAGEGIDDRIISGGVVAMAYSAEVFDYCETALVLANGQKSDRADAFADAGDAMRHLGRNLDQDLIKLDYRQYVGFMLADRLCPFSEGVLERAGEMTDVIFVGGMAGDDYKFIDAQAVFYEGRAYQNAAVLALWRPKAGFSFLKTQAVEKTDTQMIITRADESENIIWELDGKPAAEVYACHIGAKPECMDVVDFDGHPLAVTADGEPFVRSIMKTVDGGGLKTFASIREGTSQMLTKAGDVLGATKMALDAKKRELGDIAAILHVNCASRNTTLKNNNQVEAFGKLFTGIPNISFFSYGEIYVGTLTMTSTMILFK